MGSPEWWPPIVVQFLAFVLFGGALAFLFKQLLSHAQQEVDKTADKMLRSMEKLRDEIHALTRAVDALAGHVQRNTDRIERNQHRLDDHGGRVRSLELSLAEQKKGGS